MSAAAVVSLIGVALTVAVLAIYLTGVAMMLRHVSFTVGTIIAALRAIASQAEPVGMVLGEINRDLADARSTLERLLAAKSAGMSVGQAEQQQAARRSRPPRARAPQ